MIIDRLTKIRYLRSKGKPTVSIYRFEKLIGDKYMGPFTNGDTSHIFPMGLKKTPDEAGLIFGAGMLTGCRNPHLLLEWFSQIGISWLLEKDYVLARYDLTSATSTTDQSVFYKDDIIKRTEINDDPKGFILQDYYRSNGMNETFIERKMERRRIRAQKKKELADVN